MNCTLTIKQQKLLFGKVAIDLKNMKVFDFKEYAKQFHDLILNKTGDRVLAANYVALLPMNIRALSFDKTLYAKTSKQAGVIADHEARFEDFNKVEKFISDVIGNPADLIGVAKTIQQDSLTKSPEQEEAPSLEVQPSENVSLSDVPFDDRDFLKPGMQIYADAKDALIKNKQPDGSSKVGDVEVRLSVVPTTDFNVGDFYPDTQTMILSDPKFVDIAKQGVVLAITDMTGKPIRFNADLTKSETDEGKIIYYNMRKPVVGEPFKRPDLDLVESLKAQGMTQVQAVEVVNKKLALIRKIRDHVAKTGKAVPVNITGGNIQYAPVKAKSKKPNISAINFGEGSFKPYKGIPSNKQFPNVYYFDMPGSNLTLSVDSPPVPSDIVQKLIQLLTEDISVAQGSKRFEYAAAEKIKLFNQFVYVDPAAFELTTDKGGKLVVKKMGSVVNFADKAAFAEFLTDLLTRRPVTEKITAAQAKGLTRAVSLKTANFGNVYENVLPSGDVDYYKIGQVQLKVNDTAFKNNSFTDFTLSPGEGGFTINTESKPYYPWVASNFLIKYDVDAKGNFQKLSSSVEFELAPEGFVQLTKQEASVSDIDKLKQSIPSLDGKNVSDVFQMMSAILQAQGSKGGSVQLPIVGNKLPDGKYTFDDLMSVVSSKVSEDVFDKLEDLIKSEGLQETYSNVKAEPVVKPLSAKEKLKKLAQEDPAKFDKLVGQKGLDATLEQIDAAEKWYNNHPMSKYFPFETLFDVVNQKDSNSIATWTTSGITLYKGSDYSDLYHEAWHGFTQGFMSKEEKAGLYAETKKLSGTFSDYVGKTVKFSEASDLQLEEYLAEDFRQYMISGGKIAGSAKRNSIFRRILNFLKQLFGSSSVKDVVSDKQATEAIRNLYEKLRVGDLSDYTFSDENRNFDTLNKALVAIRKNEAQPTLSFENSNLIFNTVNGLFSEAIDVMNQANVDTINERRDLQSKKDLTAKESLRLDELNTQVTYNYTTAMLSTVKGLKTLYSYVKDSLEEKYNDFVELDKTKPSQETKNNIDLLKYALRNFGDLENLSNNRAGEGVIGYHLYKSDLIESDVFDELAEQSELVDRELEGKQVFDRGGNESSIFDLANREVATIVKSLNKTDMNGVVSTNRLGFPELVSFREAFAHIARMVQNAKDVDEMYSRMENEKNSYPPIKQLLNKLGPVSHPGQTDREVKLWSKFYQTYNKYRIALLQTTVNEQEGKDEFGEKTPSIFDVRIGNALADYKRIDTDWRADFAKANSNPFILNDVRGNYLDLTKLFERYPTIDVVNSNPLRFLNDIGIKMKNIPVIEQEVRKAISSGNIRLNGIYMNLTKLQQLGFTVRGMGSYLTHDPKNGIVGQTGQNSNYGKLLAIQSKFSGDYSDFMVQNAAGDPQSEFSQNSSLTQQVKQINSVASYNELVNNPPTAHYNNAKNTPGRPYNPFINASIWIKSLFNMSSMDGMRYDNNEVVIENLSGINSSINDNFFEDGVATSQADEVGKLLNDFHIQLMKFTPELTRHAGKKTSLAVSLRDYKTGSRNSKLYIDTEDFITQQGEFNQGFDNFYKILVKYLGAELDRVNYAKYLLSPQAGVKEFDFNYLNRASKLVAFSSVLSDETKNALYELTGSLEDHIASPQGKALQEKIYDEMFSYFNNLVKGVETKMDKNSFVSPTLIEKVKTDGKKLNKVATDKNVRSALTQSFVANNWIHHFEEMIMLYGDIAMYKDFFKRNASLNSTGDIVRNDPSFVKYANEKLGKGFSKKAGAPEDVLTYTGILHTAVVSDVEVKSAYYDQYVKAVDSASTKKGYGEKGIKESDAQGVVAFDTYRILLDGLGKWTNEQERVYQELLSGKKQASEIKSAEFFPVLKMGYYGPIQNDLLPITGLHKFALMPLIPGVIPENLRDLHDKMMKEGIDYMTFDSGSKVGTITGKEGMQPFYSDTTKRELNKTPFVKNNVFVEYLKYQVESKPKYKGRVTLMTQLRKLVELGLMENGVPTDFKGEAPAWNALTESEKLETSKNYTLRQNYLNALKQLVEVKKNQLLAEIGWKKDVNGNVTGDMNSLLELVSNELKRNDVGEHEWNYIQTIKGRDIKNSLDISQSADVIEKVVTSLVNKRLINIKVNGEQLVMVSTTGFEDKAFAYGPERNFEKPTAEDLEKYGTNDLPGYYINKKGIIAAAKVKIALQGNFKLLLQLEDVKEKSSALGINRLQALNLLLKDDTWLDQNDHRSMISMVGARIPTQGPNSADFVEVYEFLPEIAGNIIIAPSEVVSKSGTDFDYDKLPLMMPNIRWNKGKVELAKKASKKEAKEIYDELVKEGLHKMTFAGLDKNEIRALLQTSDRFEKTDNVLANLMGPDYMEEMINLVKENTVKDFDTFYENWNGAKVVENDLISSMKAILERPDNFGDLIRPNDTHTLKPIADKIRGEIGDTRGGSHIFEPLTNLDVQQANSIGKDTLGIGAISNTFNAIFNSIGLTLPQEFKTGFMNSATARVKILLPHNQKDGRISLSNLEAVNGENTADIISQLINGWVDVEKDDWISYIQGNKEVAPILLLLVQAGVPINDVVNFVTHPIIKEYVEQQRLQKSSFAKALGIKTGRFYKAAARKNMMRKFGFDKASVADISALAEVYTEGIDDFSKITTSLETSSGEAATQEQKTSQTFTDLKALQAALSKNISLPTFEKSIKVLLKKAESEQEAKFVYRKLSILTHPDKGGKTEFSQALNDLYDKYKQGELDFEGVVINKNKPKKINYELAFLLHYMELEQIAQKLGDFQRVFNVDTTTQQSLTEFYTKTKDVEQISENTGGLIEPRFVKNVVDNSPIGPFYVQHFALDIFGKLLPLRNKPELNSFISDIQNNVHPLSQFVNDIYPLDTQDNKIKFAQTFKNDLINYIFQNTARQFKPEDSYKKPENSELTTTEGVEFSTEMEREHFFHEREKVRKLYPFSSISGSIAFAEIMKENERKDELKLENESTEDFVKRLEAMSYEEFVQEKALYNILNPWQLFKAKTNVASTYGFILSKYPQLKDRFSILNNIKKSSKEKITNLMLSTMKFDKDEVDAFHENLKDLANSDKLLKIDGINQKDADYISDFFGKLPLYLYMQTGPNTKNAFSFGRVLPQDKILRILEKPVQEVTQNLDEQYLENYLSSFITVNSNKTTRNRFKDYLKNTDIMGSKQSDAQTSLNLGNVSEGTNDDLLTKKNIFTVTPIQKADKKAKAKASIATQFIGFGEGIVGSSTESYRKEVIVVANTGDYSSKDVIFVSIPGKRGDAAIAKREQDKTIREVIKALEAGAKILTDNSDYTNASSYNTGEQRLFANLQAKGYKYSEVIVDGETIGVWNNPLASAKTTNETVNPIEESKDILWNNNKTKIFERYPDLKFEDFQKMSQEEKQQLISCL